MCRNHVWLASVAIWGIHGHGCCVKDKTCLTKTWPICRQLNPKKLRGPNTVVICVWGPPKMLSMGTSGPNYLACIMVAGKIYRYMILDSFYNLSIKASVPQADLNIIWKLGGCLFGAPHNKDYTIVHWGPPILGDDHIGDYSSPEKRCLALIAGAVRVGVSSPKSNINR